MRLAFAIRLLPLGGFLTVACTTIRTVHPSDLSAPNPPTRVWVTRADQSVAVFDSARVERNSIVGVVNGLPQRIPLSEITRFQAREPSPARTEELIVGGLFAGYAVL